MLLLLLFAVASDYRAVGTEPFWVLTIGQGRIRLEELERPPVTVRTPVKRSGPGWRRYRTRRMTVTIAPGPCSDGMSDRRYPDSVTVVTGGRTLRGCGGLAAVQR